jgi:signal peptidase II
MWKMRRYFVFLIVPIIFFLDRWAKLLVFEKLTYLESIKLTPFFSIVHARNYGGVFGFLSQYQFAKYIFTIFPLLIIAVLIYIVLTHKFVFPKTLSLLCILSGAIGNIYDRISYGYVIDFLDAYYKGYHWPAFNVADISITFGICLWLYVELINSIKRSKKMGVRP